MSGDLRAVFERVADLMNRQDWDGFSTVYTEDYVEEYPQSGEIIRGRANAVAVRQNYPGGFVNRAVDTASARVAGSDAWVMTPRFTVVRAEGSGNAGTVMWRVLYPDGSTWWIVALYELRDDRVARATMFFAPVFDPPEWRAPYRDRVSGPPPG